VETPLKGKTAVITGASRGIGRGIALALAEKGVHLVLAARAEAALRDVKRAAEKKGVKAVAVRTDVSKERDVRALAKKTAATFRRVDFLINCAGQFLEKDIFRTTAADWERIVGSNLFGTYLCVREIGKLMMDGAGGVIINFASVGGRIGLNRKAIYCASKFGVAGLSKALVKELKPHRIKIHTVYPYSVDSAGKTDWSGGEKILDILKVEDVADLVVRLVKLPFRVEIEDIYLDPFIKK
jgi:NAD(P)-dependent dehydrogenase (short-subunit alcohol dehydrogenase family)